MTATAPAAGAMAQLIEELFAKALRQRMLRQGNDGACCRRRPGRRLVMSCDSTSSP